MLGGRRLFAGMMTAILAGCSNPPGVYDLPLHEAYQRLAQDPLDDFKLARQCGILVHISPEPIQDESVTWRVFSSGEEQVNFTARLTPVGADKTRVSVEMSQDPDGTEAYSGNDFYPHPAFHQPLKPAVEEAVAAILEGRKFDVMKVPQGGENESVCNVQRAGLETRGRAFSIHDKPGEWGGE
jgi:hypothetical protein